MANEQSDPIDEERVRDRPLPSLFSTVHPIAGGGEDNAATNSQGRYPRSREPLVCFATGELEEALVGGE